MTAQQASLTDLQQDHHAAIGQLDLLSVSCGRAVFCQKTFDGYLHSDFDGGCEAAPEQVVRRRHFEFPFDDFAALVLDVDVDPGMRVQQLDLGHSPVELDGFVGVVLGGK